MEALLHDEYVQGGQSMMGRQDSESFWTPNRRL